MNVNASLCHNLKRLRIEGKKSQEQVARKLGISRSCLANYELGNREPDNQMLAKMADVYQVLTDYLLGRTTFRSKLCTVAELDEYLCVKSALAGQVRRLEMGDLSADEERLLMDYYDHLKALTGLGKRLFSKRQF